MLDAASYTVHYKEISNVKGAERNKNKHKDYI